MRREINLQTTARIVPLGFRRTYRNMSSLIDNLQRENYILKADMVKLNFQMELLMQALYEDFQRKTELYQRALETVANSIGAE